MYQILLSKCTNSWQSLHSVYWILSLGATHAFQYWRKCTVFTVCKWTHAPSKSCVTLHSNIKIVSFFLFSKPENVFIWFLKPLNGSKTIQKPSKCRRNEPWCWTVRIWRLSTSYCWDSECVTERGIPNVESSSNPRTFFTETWRVSRQGYNSTSGPVYVDSISTSTVPERYALE